MDDLSPQLPRADQLSGITPSEFDYMNAQTFEILRIKASLVALEHALAAVAEACGLSREEVKRMIDDIRRLKLQELLDHAEKLNPVLSAYLDQRKLEDL